VGKTIVAATQCGNSIFQLFYFAFSRQLFYFALQIVLFRASLFSINQKLVVNMYNKKNIIKNMFNKKGWLYFELVKVS